jgi:FXSXX-COOH protein
MEVTSGVSVNESGFESDRVDLTGISLEKIALLPDSVLAASLHRILAENSDPAEQYARFQEHI